MSFVVSIDVTYSIIFVLNILLFPIDLSFSVWIHLLFGSSSSSFSHSQYGILCNAGQFPDTTKKMHPYSMPLLIIAIWHMPIFGMLGIIVGTQHYFSAYGFAQFIDISLQNTIFLLMDLLIIH